MKKWMTAILVIGLVVGFSTLLASSVNAKNTTKGKPINTPNLMTTVIVDYMRPDHAGPPDGGGGGGDPDHALGLGHFEVFGIWPGPHPMIEFFIDLTGFPTGSEEAFFNALESWDMRTSANLFAEYTLGPIVLDFGDGISTISMANLGGGGVLAATFITWIDDNTNGQPDPGEERTEMDIVHNFKVKWNTPDISDPRGKWFDLEGVAAHEIGHALGMDHTGDLHPEDAFQAMFSSVASGIASEDLRSLEEDGDVLGVLFLYPDAP